MSATSVLRTGDSGDAVRDLQQRLTVAGFAIPVAEMSSFGPGTERAVRDFQTHRKVRIDGVVGPETWSVLVESGFALGDRLLYQRSPNLRGDDVTALQRTLNRLGFDAGREDGILGPETAGALREYQRNAGLSVDGIAGPATLDAFKRVEAMAAGSVASVRERDELRRPGGLTGRRIYVAVHPGFDQIGRPLSQALTRGGAEVMADLSGADDHELAQRANRWRADLFLALRPGDRPTSQCLYFASGDFQSERGRHAATVIGEELANAVSSLAMASDDVSGVSYSILRETRMAAVVCGLGDAAAEHLAAILAQSAEVGAAISCGVRRTFDEASSPA